MALSRQLSVDFRNRVITCLNRLSDRDTLTAATNELEAIARGLSNEGFAPFLTCLSSTDSSDKSPVRRHSVRLIGVLSTAHGDALSPHLSKMLSAVLRRLRDPDSAVRSACIHTVSSIAAQITKPPFSSILKPLVDSIFHEQDQNSQIGAPLCLAAAIEAAPDPDPAELRKLLPKLYKLVKNDCFKAKPPLISLIGSIVSVGGASNRNVLNGLVSTLIEFLSNEDWAARKAASETLGRLAVAERDLAAEFKSYCIASLDSRRFDKVKAVRETMNRALDWWKEVPATSDGGVGHALPTKSSPKGYRSGASSPTPSKCLSDTAFETPKPNRSFSRSKSLASTSSHSSTQKNSPVKFVRVKSNVGAAKSKVEVLEKHTSWLNLACKDNEISRLGAGSNDATESKDLFLMHKQLQLIESQQTSLMELLERFIGRSQNGMNSLEKRVNGLEKVLDEMQHCLGGSSSLSPNYNTSCLLSSSSWS